MEELEAEHAATALAQGRLNGSDSVVEQFVQLLVHGGGGAVRVVLAPAAHAYRASVKAPKLQFLQGDNMEVMYYGLQDGGHYRLQDGDHVLWATK